jgi:hypothetical protein
LPEERAEIRPDSPRAAAASRDQPEERVTHCVPA